MPFIARWPGKIPACKTTDLISAQYDLMATLAELTNQKLENSDGISFLPEMLGKTERQANHEFLYFEYPEKGGQVAIRLGNWKGVRTNVRKEPNASWQIYKLRTDRNETTDVAEQNPELVKRFDTIQKRENQHAHIREWEFIDPKFYPKND